MVRDRYNCYFLFWAIFCSFTPCNSLKNQNFKKKKRKKSLEISSFYTCVPKMMIRWCMVPEIWYATDGRMDRWTGKSGIEVGAPPKKNQYFEHSATLFGMKKKKNCKQNSLIQTLVCNSNIYYSKICERGNWKNNSSTLPLEVWTRYFRHSYSIKIFRT